MTQLAALAGATKLTGKVSITDRKGVTTLYDNEDAAHDAWKDKLDRLEHRRGAFFEKPKAAPKKAEPAIEVETERTGSGRRKRKS